MPRGASNGSCRQTSWQPASTLVAPRDPCERRGRARLYQQHVLQADDGVIFGTALRS